MGSRLIRHPALPQVHRDGAAERRAERVAGGERVRAGATVSREGAPPALVSGPGQSLPIDEMHYFERRLGAALDGVRIHPEAASTHALGARAFAHGRDIGFAPGRWQPGTTEGRRLLGHELAHVLEQGAAGQSALQLDEAARPEEADKASETLTEGLTTVLEQAKENEGVKRVLLEPAKRTALARWSALGTGEKVGAAGFAAGTYGLALGAGLSDPAGRKLLSDVNLVAPLGLVPYSTLTDFRYVLPETPGGPKQLRASFSGDELLGLAHRKLSWMPPMTLGLDLGWSVDASGNAGLTSAKATWGVMPGVKLQAGSGVGLDWKPVVAGPGGESVTVMKSLPAPGTRAMPPAGAGVFVTVDLLKAPFVPAAVRAALGGAAPEK